jgi:hypothetical protein
MIFSKYKLHQILIPSTFFIAVPFVTGDYMAFGIFNVWINLGYVFIILALLLTLEFLETKIYLQLFFSIILIVFSISIYQSFVSAILTLISSVFTCKILKISKINLELIRFYVTSLGILIISIIIYFILNKLAQTYIMPAYGYLNNQYLGYNDNAFVLLVFYEILKYSLSIIVGTNIFGGWIIFTTIAILVLSSLLMFFKNLNLRTNLLFMFSIWFLIFSPFSLSILLGSQMPGRALQGIPILLFSSWFIILNNEILGKNYIAILVGSWLAFFSIQHQARLFYGDNLRYKSDVNLAQEIMHSIGESGIDYRDFPLAIIGSRVRDSNIYISETNSGGRSFFDDESQFYRMNYFIQSIGYSVKTINYVQMDEARELGKDLKVWPQVGSVAQIGEYLIVRLS